MIRRTQRLKQSVDGSLECFMWLGRSQLRLKLRPQVDILASLDRPEDILHELIRLIGGRRGDSHKSARPRGMVILICPWPTQQLSDQSLYGYHRDLPPI
jgi:hypothetical protein